MSVDDPPTFCDAYESSESEDESAAAIEREWPAWPAVFPSFDGSSPSHQIDYPKRGLVASRVLSLETRYGLQEQTMNDKKPLTVPTVPSSDSKNTTPPSWRSNVVDHTSGDLSPMQPSIEVREFVHRKLSPKNSRVYFIESQNEEPSLLNEETVIVTPDASGDEDSLMQSIEKVHNSKGDWAVEVPADDDSLFRSLASSTTSQEQDDVATTKGTFLRIFHTKNRKPKVKNDEKSMCDGKMSDGGSDAAAFLNSLSVNNSDNCSERHGPSLVQQLDHERFECYPTANLGNSMSDVIESVFNGSFSLTSYSEPNTAAIPVDDASSDKTNSGDATMGASYMKHPAPNCEVVDTSLIHCVGAVTDTLDHCQQRETEKSDDEFTAAGGSLTEAFLSRKEDIFDYQCFDFLLVCDDDEDEDTDADFDAKGSSLTLTDGDTMTTIYTYPPAQSTGTGDSSSLPPLPPAGDPDPSATSDASIRTRALFTVGNVSVVQSKDTSVGPSLKHPRNSSMELYPVYHRNGVGMTTLSLTTPIKAKYYGKDQSTRAQNIGVHREPKLANERNKKVPAMFSQQETPPSKPVLPLADESRSNRPPGLFTRLLQRTNRGNEKLQRKKRFWGKRSTKRSI
jgi:hypothetical protein